MGDVVIVEVADGLGGIEAVGGEVTVAVDVAVAESDGVRDGVADGRGVAVRLGEAVGVEVEGSRSASAKLPRTGV